MKKSFFQVIESGEIQYLSIKSVTKKFVVFILFVFLTLFSFQTFSQTISGTGSRTTNCGSCTPAGWLDTGGTPDVSTRTNAGGQGTGGGNAPWANAPLPLPPTGDLTWITMRDVGDINTQQEESVTTTMGDLVNGKLYKLSIYYMSSITTANGESSTTYAGAYMDAFDYQINTTARQRTAVLSSAYDKWAAKDYVFRAAPNANGQMTLTFYPRDNVVAGGSFTNVESISIAVELNAIEELDTDKDGIPDTIDIDDDNDGILDTVETTIGGIYYNPLGDEDGDLLPNYLDTRDDGTGDGSNTNYNDINGDGVADIFDFDNDGIPNHLDLDSDNDGIPDIIEGQPTATYIAPTGNVGTNGLDSAFENNDSASATSFTVVNTDGTPNTPDFLDLDSDNDGVSDTIEANTNLSEDVGKNGLDNNYDNGDTYTDPNGTYDNTQTDNFPDTTPGGDVNWRDISTVAAKDTDGDGIPDNVDIDDDNDGILDTVECPLVTVAAGNATAQTNFGVTNPGGAIGSDNSRAILNSLADQLVIDLGRVVAKNTIIEIESLVTNINNYMSVEQSTTTSNYTNAKSYTWTTINTEENKKYKLTAAARYIKIKIPVYGGGTPTELQIDNVSYQAFTVVCDNDGDGVPNIVDLDSDNDGIPDNIEAQATTGYIAPNGVYGANGLDSAYENNDTTSATGLGGAGGAGLINTDGTDNRDYLDTDSDNDGTSDRIEANLSLSGVYGKNGLDKNYESADNYSDVNGTFDNTPYNDFPDNPSGGQIDWRDATSSFTDNDNDGIPDSVDIDDDNDGILDIVEDNVNCGSSKYNFTSQASAESNWNFTDPVGNTLQGPNSARQWSWDNNDTTSGGVGPNIGQGDAGYVYTEMSAPGANGDVFTAELDVNFDASDKNITFSYYFGYRGNGNNGTIQLQSNENGAGWTNRGAPEVLDQQGLAQNSAFSWIQKTVDLSGLISGNATRFRLVITQGNNGTSWHKDVGLDSVTVSFCSSDTDGDGIPNSLDLDSDNDGIPDNIEAQSTKGYIAPTGNVGANGLDSAYENNDTTSATGLGGANGTGLINTDSANDTIPDYLDLDSDNDGKLDNTEAGLTLSGVYGTNGLDNNYDNGDNYTDVNGSFDNTQTDNFPDADNDVNTTGDVDYRDNTFVLDTDGDGIPDTTDLDDDNDGILDIIENGNCNISQKEEVIILFSEDFGTGTTRTTNANVINHTYQATGAIPDGSYAVASSLSTGLETYNRTDLNGNRDANINQFTGPAGGSNNGRYLSINLINTGNTGFYRKSFNNLIIGADYRFRVDLAGLCNNCADLPIFRLEIQDPNNGNNVLESISSASLGVLNNDIWQRVALNFKASKTALDIVIVNDQPNGGAGNDVGVDNIVFGVLQCPAAFNDFDGDGIINSLDLDSDNDGIPDVIEAGGTDTNRDGRADGTVGTTPTTNGIPSSANGGIGISIPRNSDTDSLPDYIDIDADNDGIPDNIEGQTSSGYLAPSGIAKSIRDANKNGVDDNYEVGAIIGVLPPNTDGTDNPDYRDADSDNDGILDIIENGDADNSLSGLDSDGDGLDNNFDDNNDLAIAGFTVNDGLGTGNKITNTTTLDTAYGDEDSDFPGTGDVDYRDIKDTDGDGVADYFDIDDDNDGILDINEVSGNNNPNGDEDGDGIPNFKDTIDNGNAGDGSTTNYTDSNADGIPDVYDTDGDGIPNHLDLDADNDGIPDNIEAQSTRDYIAPSGNDADKDGLDDAYDTTPNGNVNGAGSIGITPINTDATATTGADTIPDYLDLDSDGDGIFDVIESGENLPNDGAGKSTGTFGKNGLNNLAETGGVDLGYTDVNGKYDNTQTDNFTDTDGDVLTIGDVDYRDTTADGVPMITQVYQFGTERWIEVTNISTTRTISANKVKVQLYKNKTGDQTGITPDVTYTVTTALAPGQSVLFKNSANTITNVRGAATVVTNNTLTDIADANDIITLSSKNDTNSYKFRYDVIAAFANKTSYVRIDNTLLPNKTYTPSEWVVFIDDALDPYRLLGAGGPERHPHDPLISEIGTSNAEANTLLGLHRVNFTYRTGGAWSNGYPDRSRFVFIDQDYNHTGSRLSARILAVNPSKKLSVTDNLLVVTNNIVLNGEIRLVNPAMDGAAQLIQTHQGASLVIGTTGKLLVDQNSTVPSKYRYNYIGSPVKTATGSTTYTVADVLKDGTTPTNTTGVINASGPTGIAKNINWISGLDGNFTSSPNSAIALADYWIYTYSANGGARAGWVQKFNSGPIPNTDGFIFKGPGRPQNYTYVGIPKDGDITTTVGKDESYLVANPYASSISVKKFIEDNINAISGTLYFWEHAGEKVSSEESSAGHNFRGYVGGYATRTITMGVTAKNAAGGPIDTNLQAEAATNVGGIVENVLDTATQTVIDVMKWNASNQTVTFKKIPGGIDTLRVRYKTSVDKLVRLKVNSNTINDYTLKATTGGFFGIAEIPFCIERGSDITLESLDTTILQFDYLKLKDDGELACAPNVGGDDITYTEPKPYIPVGQGFFVQGDDTDGGTITFNNSQREYILEGTEAAFLKANSKSDPNSIVNLPVIKLGMDFNNTEDGKLFHRQIGVSFSQYTSFEDDKGYDAEIYDIGNTDFYWKFPNNDKKYVIAGVQSIAKDLEVPLEIVMGASGYVTLKVDEMKNVDGLVYIVDKVTGISYEIINDKASLTLEQGEYKDRFFLTFKPTNTTLSVEEENIANSYTNIHVDNQNKMLVISKEQDITIHQVKVYSILGREIYNWQVNEQKQSLQFNLNKKLPTSIYFVKLKTDKGEISKKIILE